MSQTTSCSEGRVIDSHFTCPPSAAAPGRGFVFWIWGLQAKGDTFNRDVGTDLVYEPFKDWWLLHLPPGLSFNNSTFCPHSVFVCFVWIWEQTAIISLYSINWPVFITERKCVYCVVRTGSLYIILRSAHTVYVRVLCGSENKQRLVPFTA